MTRPEAAVKLVDQLDSITASARAVGKTEVAIRKIKEFRVRHGGFIPSDHTAYASERVKIAGLQHARIDERRSMHIASNVEVARFVISKSDVIMGIPATKHATQSTLINRTGYGIDTGDG